MRALKIATVIMGVLILFGTAALVIVVVRRGVSPARPALPATVATALQEPAGTRIAGIAALQDRLAVQLQGGGPDRVLLIDPRSGAVSGRITLAEP